jgi:hypothetical protein
MRARDLLRHAFAMIGAAAFALVWFWAGDLLAVAVGWQPMVAGQ